MAEYDAVEGDRWTGWIAFAGILMVIGGCLQAFYGLVAILNDEWVVWANRGSVLLDLTQWGWIQAPKDRTVAAVNLRREKLDPLMREAAAATPGVE